MNKNIFKYLLAFSAAPWPLPGSLLIKWLVLRWTLLTFNLNKTPLGETECLGNTYFFDSPLPQHSQLGYV